MSPTGSGLLLGAAMLACLLVASPAAAEAQWERLSAQQRQALAPLQPHWAGIDAERRQKWLELAARISTMSPQERDRMQERMVGWAYLPPAERGRARLQFQESRRLPAEERQMLWNEYQALPAEQRERLARQAQERAAGARPPAVSDTAAALQRSGAPTQALPQAGLPRITATPEFVEPQTLLPRRGAQAVGRKPAPPARAEERPSSGGEKR